MFIIVLLGICMPIIAKTVSISGIVTDKEHNPIEYAVVVLKNNEDSTMLSSCLTQKGGKFTILTPYQKSRLIISFIGYETFEAPIECYSDTSITITLKENAKLLNEVTVTGYRPSIKLTDEGFMTQIHNTVLSKSGTAMDVLENIPLVQKTAEGFSVFGKGSPTIYIDGRRIYDLSELDGLKSQDIKNVELITNPGAKYDASVSSIIKITKISNNTNVFAFDNRTSFIQSKHTSGIEQLSINYKKNKFEIFNNFKYSTIAKSATKVATHDVYADTIWNYNTYETESHRKQSFENTLNLNFNITQNHSIGCRYIINYSPSYKEDVNSNSLITADKKIYDKIDNFGCNRFSSNNTHRLNFFYSGKIRNWKIDYDFYFLSGSNTANSKFNESSSLSYDQTVMATNKIRNRLISSKIIFNHGLFGGSLNIGMDYNRTNRFDQYVSHNNIVNSSNIRMIESRINPFIEFSRMFSFGLINVGFRYENTTTNYIASGTKGDSKKMISNQIFPNASFSSKIGNLQWQFNYSSRTQRPTYSQLSSSILYVNRFTLQTGNPFLKPEYSHNISLQGLWKFMQFNIEYQDKKNAIIYWATQNSNNESITTISYKNLISIKRLSSVITLFYPIGIWNPRLTVGCNRQFLTLKNSNTTMALNKPLFYAQMVNTFKLPLAFNLIISGNYQSKGNHQNIYLNKNVFYLDVTLIKTFSKDRYAIQLKLNDVFKTMKDGNTIFNDKMIMNLNNSYDSRKITLTFRYRFNSIKNKDRKISFIEDEINRL